MYLYRFINSDNKPIYIGKTRDLNKRISQHFKNNREFATFNNKIEFTELSQSLADNLEIELIKLYQPKFNIQCKTLDISILSAKATALHWQPASNIKLKDLL